MPEVRSILIADDNGDVRDALAIALRADGFGVSAASDAYEARRLFVAARPDLVLSDIRMPGDGMMLLRAVRTLSPGTPVILMTAFEQPGDRTRAMAGGATDFLVKPVMGARLLSAVSRAFARRTSHASKQREHQQDEQHRSERPARSVSPSAAVRPAWKRPDDENK
jgi:DNA-binding NtrC family response regulator